MQIAAHILAYNVNNTLKLVVENISPHVNKIFIAYPFRPFAYNLIQRETKLNPTSLKDVISVTDGCNIEILEGDWKYEEDMRNACFEAAKKQGFDWFLTQDADEFYDEKGWELILKELKKSINDDFYQTTWFNFWKSSEYVVLENGNIKSKNANFALRCKKNIKFIRKRLANIETAKVIDSECYHYGYVHTNEQMKNKIETWSHTNDFNKYNWITNKWLNWQENTLNLNPTNPTMWKRAIKFPYKQPPFSNNFRNKIVFNKVSFDEKFSNYKYDCKYTIKEYLRNIKKSINVKLK
tara:strand:+ start:1487 stop:2371 length:885 start_codon:yes stop_codon:yes gene_type:complete